MPVFGLLSGDDADGTAMIGLSLVQFSDLCHEIGFLFNIAKTASFWYCNKSAKALHHPSPSTSLAAIHFRIPGYVLCIQSSWPRAVVDQMPARPPARGCAAEKTHVDHGSDMLRYRGGLGSNIQANWKRARWSKLWITSPQGNDFRGIHECGEGG